MLWIGWSLAFTTPTHIMYMSLDGTVHPLTSLEHQGTGTIAFVWNSREDIE